MKKLETIDFQGKKWVIVGKVKVHLVTDPSTLKSSYMCDLVLKNNQNVFFMLEEIIDAEFKEI